MFSFVGEDGSSSFHALFFLLLIKISLSIKEMRDPFFHCCLFFLNVVFFAIYASGEGYLHENKTPNKRMTPAIVSLKELSKI